MLLVHTTNLVNSNIVIFVTEERLCQGVISVGNPKVFTDLKSHFSVGKALADKIAEALGASVEYVVVSRHTVEVSFKSFLELTMYQEKVKGIIREMQPGEDVLTEASSQMYCSSYWKD